MTAEGKMHLNTVNILGVKVISTSWQLVLDKLSSFMAKPFTNPLVVFTPNPEFLVEAVNDRKFCELLNKADINLPDGVGLVWAGRVLDKPIKERISGSDMVEKLLEIGNSIKFNNTRKKFIVGIAGARRGVLEEAKILVKRLSEKYRNIEFVNLDNPKLSIINYQLSKDISKDFNIGNSLKFVNWKLNIVFACHGMKKQEEWIINNKDKINANVFMGVGGSLDFLAGFTRRAPIWMRRCGLEWLWRGLQRPKHFRRIWKAVFVFGVLVLKEKFNSQFSKYRPQIIN